MFKQPQAQPLPAVPTPPTPPPMFGEQSPTTKKPRAQTPPSFLGTGASAAATGSNLGVKTLLGA